MNLSISKFAPKDLTLSTTQGLQYRIALAVGIDAVGWLEYISRVFQAFGPAYSIEDSLLKLLETKQTRKLYWQERQTKTSVRQKRKEQIMEKIWSQKVDDTRANQMYLGYGPGMAMNLPDGCKHCGKPGHKRKTHKDCTANPKNILQEPGSNVATKEGETNKQNAVPKCKSCGKEGHKTKAHSSCPNNNKKRKQPGP
jgi:hypothetical protein